MVHMTRRSRRPARTRLLVPVLAGLLTLAACSQAQDGQSNNIEVSANQSGSGDAAHTIPMSGEYPVLPNGKLGRPVDWVEPHEPQLPSAATNMDAFGARYFAEYYLNLLAYSINTGNTTTLKKVSSPECKVCQMYLDKIPDFYSKGYWADRMEHKCSQINEAIPHPEIEGLYFVKMRVTTSPYLEFKDGTVHSIAEVDENVELEVQRNHSSFVIKSFFAEGVGDDEEAQS